MPSEKPLTPVEKLRLAFELHEAGVSLMRQNLRRRFPEASEQAIDERLQAWLEERPGAEFGDAVGRGRRVVGDRL